MTTYFITRHAGAIDWVKAKQIPFDVHLEHLLPFQELQAGDIIIGTLPINIVAQINALGVHYIHLSSQIPSHLRGMELNADQLNDCQACLEEFFVKKIEKS